MSWPTAPSTQGFDTASDNLAEGRAFIETVADAVVDIINSRYQPNGIAGLNASQLVSSVDARTKVIVMDEDGYAPLIPDGWWVHRFVPGRHLIGWSSDPHWYTLVAMSLTGNTICTTNTNAVPPIVRFPHNQEVQTYAFSDWTTLQNDTILVLARERNRPYPFQK